MMNRIFVYGALRAGHGASVLLRDTKFCGEERIPGYIMYNLYGFPGVVSGDGTIVGEVYEGLTDDQIVHLDHYEGVHSGMYRRETVEVGGKPTIIYVFNQATEPFERIHSGDWNDR